MSGFTDEFRFLFAVRRSVTGHDGRPAERRGRGFKRFAFGGTILNREYDDDFVALRVRLGRADLARAGRLLDALKPTSAEE